MELREGMECAKALGKGSLQNVQGTEKSTVAGVREKMVRR